MACTKRIVLVFSILVLAASLAAQNIDLIEKASGGAWRNGDGAVIRFGVDGRAAGSAMYRTDIVLEDGKTYPRVLHTHPQGKPHGRVEGRLSNLTIPTGRPKLIVAGGFIENAQKTDGVRLTVAWIDPQSEETPAQPQKDDIFAKLRDRLPREKEPSAQTLINLDIRYNGRIARAEVDLSAYAGKTGDILLSADAGASPDYDWAAWTEVRIEIEEETPVAPPPVIKPEPLKLLKSFQAHAGRIYSAVFSPNGRFVATVSMDRLAKIWRMPEGSGVVTISGHTAHVFAADFSADNKLLATAGRDSSGRIWEIPGGGIKTYLIGHTNEVLSVAFRRTDQQVVTSGNDGTIRVWNMNNGNELKSIDFPGDFASSLAFHPNKRWLAAGGGAGRVILLDINTGNQIREFRGHTQAIYNLRFSHDGNLIVTCSRDGSVRIWNTSGGLVRQLGGGTGYAAAFDPSGRFVVVGHDNQGAIWNVKTGKRLMTLNHPGGAIRGVDWQPDGNLVVLAGDNGQVRIWQVTIE